MTQFTLNLRLLGFLVVIFAYSLLAHHTLQTKDHAGIGTLVALGPILLTSLIFAYKAKHRYVMFGLLVLASPLIWLVWSFFKQHYEWIYWLVHESLQIVLLISFARTLLPGHQPLCTQFAAIMHKSLSPQLLSYTRKVTIAWSLFFLIIMLFSSWLFFFYPIRIWSIFSNFAYLPLVAAMFIVEYIIRINVLPKSDLGNIMTAVHSFMNQSKK